MSKGRPNCVTAQTLTDMNYPGEWFIVCGDNDETYGEYVAKWGKDRVILFDWAKWVERCDLLDPFGVENGKPSGAVPARNAIREISYRRGEERHWQLDDDFPAFYVFDQKSQKKAKIEDGNKLYYYFNRIATYGKETGLLDIGIDGASWLNADSAYKVSRQVFGVHNMPSDDSFIPWKGRMADDICLALEIARKSLGVQMSIKYLGYPYTQSATKKGGNTDLYLADGYIRKAGYANLVCPCACRVRFDNGGAPHIRMSYPSAKIIHEKYRK